MNSLQRVQAVLAGQIPDRVPVLIFNFITACREAGIPMSTYRTDAKAIAQIAKEDALEREKKAAETRVEPPPQDTLTVLTLKDGTALKAVTILEDPDGRLAVKDEQGKVHYLSAKDIVKREQMK